MAPPDKHVVLIGFMGAGKSTLGAEVALRLGRPFFDVDDAIERQHGAIWELFAREGEAAFRELEAQFLRDATAHAQPAVIAVGGGAVETRGLLETLDDVLVVHLDVDVETAWGRVRGSRRPLAQDEAEFRLRYERRAPLYSRAAHTTARDADDIVLAAAGVTWNAAPSPGSRTWCPATARRRSSATSTSPASTGWTRNSRSGRACRRCTSSPPAKPRSRCRRSTGCGRSSASTGAGRSSPSAGAPPPTPPASPPPPTCAGSTGRRSRRRSSGRSTRRSAARPRSTCRRARTSSAPSTGRAAP